MEAFQWEEREDTTPLFVHMIAGSFAGISEHLSMIPIDNVKTHCQVARNSIFSIISKIYRAGGLGNFYAGSSVVASGCAPAHAIYFSIYEWAKQALHCKPEEDVSKFALVGAISSMFHDLIMNPTETLKQRVQIMRANNSKLSVFEVARSIYKNQGILAFYRSFPISYAMNIPFGSLLILSNEKLKHFFGVNDQDQGLKFYICGALAGGIASLPTTPLDVIKTKLNTQGCANGMCEKTAVCNILKNKIERNIEPKEDIDFRFKKKGLLTIETSMFSTRKPYIKYRNVADTAMTIWKEEGITGFFRGAQMRMTIQSLSSGVAWGTYQFLKGVFTTPLY